MGVFPPPASPAHRVADGEPFEKVLGSSENECKEKRSEVPAPGNVSAGQLEADAAGTTRDMVAEALCSSSTPLDLKMGSAIPHSLAIPCPSPSLFLCCGRIVEEVGLNAVVGRGCLRAVRCTLFLFPPRCASVASCVRWARTSWHGVTTSDVYASDLLCPPPFPCSCSLVGKGNDPWKWGSGLGSASGGWLQARAAGPFFLGGSQQPGLEFFVGYGRERLDFERGGGARRRPQ